MSDPGQTHYAGDGCEPAHELPSNVYYDGLSEVLAKREADCRRADARLAVAERMAEELRDVVPPDVTDDGWCAYCRNAPWIGHEEDCYWSSVAPLLAQWDALRERAGIVPPSDA